MIPISGLTWLFNGAVSLLIAWRLHKTYLGSQDQEKPVLKYFVLFFLNMGIFLIAIFIPHIAVFNHKYAYLFPKIMAWAHDGPLHVFLYIAFAYIVSVPLRLYFPKIRGPYFVFIIVAGVITVAFTTYFAPQYPSRFDSSSGLTFLAHHPLVGKVTERTLAIISFAPAIIIFLIKGLPSPHKFVRIRSLLFIFGFVMMAVAGPLNAAADTAKEVLLGNTLTLIGFLFIAAGIFYKREWVEEAPGL